LTALDAKHILRACGSFARGSFLARMNKLCMGMAAAGRKPGGQEAEESVIAQMKTLPRTIAAHARRHRAALDEGWTRGQAGQILGRIDGIISQLPAAIRRAHERIMGERPVANADKLLSLCEGSLHVFVRGKAGAEVEFGNTLLLAENLDGSIVDHALLRERSPGDTRLLEESLTRINTLGIRLVLGIGTDRGFASRANSRFLEEMNIFDATCPRDPADLTRRHREDGLFAACQRRRAQTEERVGILKNNFLSGQPRARGDGRRVAAVDWAVLAHNLRTHRPAPAGPRKARHRRRPGRSPGGRIGSLPANIKRPEKPSGWKLAYRK